MIGTPKQLIRAQVDTAAASILVPADQRTCPGCSSAAGKRYTGHIIDSATNSMSLE